jgi:hypothetical protein
LEDKVRNLENEISKLKSDSYRSWWHVWLAWFVSIFFSLTPIFINELIHRIENHDDYWIDIIFLIFEGFFLIFCIVTAILYNKRYKESISRSRSTEK